MTLPKSKYRCRKCLYEFEKDEPGPTECPNCGHYYVDWLNSNEVLSICRVIDGRFD